MKIAQFLIHIRLLQLLGFRIVAFDVDPIVLTGGNPRLLGKALDEFMGIVKSDSSDHRVAGAYGISLGSFFAMNAVTLPNVNRIFLNTGGGSIVRAIWDMDALKSVKKGFEDHGYDRGQMEKFWNPIDTSQNIKKIVGKYMIANASYADEYIPIDDVLILTKDWKEEGVNARFILSKHLNHRWLIIKTMSRLWLTSKFFRGSVYSKRRGEYEQERF